MNSSTGAKVADNHQNVRASERFDLEVKVDLESDHNFYTGLTQNISSGGVFIATHHIRKIGDRITLKFSAAGFGPAARGRDRGALDSRELRRSIGSTAPAGWVSGSST